MPIRVIEQEANQLILHTNGIMCNSIKELASSVALKDIVRRYIVELRDHNSPLLETLFIDPDDSINIELLIELLNRLCVVPLDQAVKLIPNSTHYLDNKQALRELVEGIYNYWRSFDRFMVCHSKAGPESLDKHPYRTFNTTVEQLMHLVRALYRDICEHITNDHPRVYRQVSAGCEVGLIATTYNWNCPEDYENLIQGIPMIRQVLLNPPVIIYPPMNKRTGEFKRVAENPLQGLSINKDKWLCYPAQVGSLVIYIYFNVKFIGLGSTLANLFELASDEQLEKGPDAVYLYGAPMSAMERFGDLPTVFYEDNKNNLLVAAVPDEDRFGYFGYLKKMVLTLHNIVMMKRGRMPFHGAMVRIVLKNGAAANILLIGDTAAGKSETLEAFRLLGHDYIRDLRIIADDMGSLDINAEGRLVGYGTEIGAFIRLDDLQHGYAFGQLDRAIIHNPHLVNARVILPVATMQDVLAGFPIDILLYANNYEEVDSDHPIIEPLETLDRAFATFREAAAMAKGTTTSTGLVHTYFANIFGAVQYKDLHDELAKKIFQTAFDTKVFVGQLRTRLGIQGYESEGPENAAKALFELITSHKS